MWTWPGCWGRSERAGAKMIVVGDDRQLDAVGPGGALTALAARHPEHVWTLSDNLRQTLPGRAGRAWPSCATGTSPPRWAGTPGPAASIPSPTGAGRCNAMVRAWAADIAAGQETLMLAYRRDNVEALNQTARRLWEQAGLLSGSGAGRARRPALPGRGPDHHPGPRTRRRLGHLPGRPGHRRRPAHTAVDRGHPRRPAAADGTRRHQPPSASATGTPSPPTAVKAPPWTSPTSSTTAADENSPTWP